MTTTSERLWSIVNADDLPPRLTNDCCAFINSHFKPSFGREIAPSYIEWKLGDANPAGGGFLTLALHDGRVVGCLTGTRKRLWAEDKELTACELGDGFTHPNYRRGCRALIPYRDTSDPNAYLNKSIFGRLGVEQTQRMLEGGCEFIYGTPNHLARPGWTTKNGYVEMDHQRIISAHLPTRLLSDLGTGLGARAVARLQRVMWRATQPVFRRGLNRHGLSFERACPDDDALDNLWVRARRLGTRQAQLVKDSRYMHHRYTQMPGVSYEWITWSVNGRLAGLLVSRRVRRANGMMTLAIVDWLLDSAHTDLFPYALFETISGDHEDLDTISVWVDSVLGRDPRFLGMGFLPRRRQSLIVFPTPLARRLIERRTPFDVTLGSTDNG